MVTSQPSSDGFFVNLIIKSKLIAVYILIELPLYLNFKN